MPALQTIKTWPIREQRRLLGLLVKTAVDGEGTLTREQFKPFKGNDAIDGMCEYRVGANMGRRVLGFRCRIPTRVGDDSSSQNTMLLAHAFDKPPQDETPGRDKAQAREVAQEYVSTLHRS